jgi:hypothetical protein
MGERVVSPFSDIPEDVAGFLDTYVDSLNSLEALLVVAREPLRSWTAAQVAAHLGVVVGAAQRELDRCVRLGLMVQDGGAVPVYLFKPGDPARAEAVARIAACYRSHRVGVINHVASRAIKRIQALADAFRVGRRNGDE